MDVKHASKSQERAQAQRGRILAAAQACFVKHGFHAASMANIADTAQMSAGLIYRYFDSKSEIILAIIEQQLQLARVEVAQLHGSMDMAEELWKSFGQKCAEPHEHRMDPALFLEMSAEASRDAQIAAAVHSSDVILREDFCQWLSRRPEEGGLGIAPDKSQSVALLLQCLIEGLKIRGLREPDFDRAVLRSALRTFLPALLSPDP